MMKIDYGEAWKELREAILKIIEEYDHNAFMTDEGSCALSTIQEKMNTLEKKYTQQKEEIL